MNIPSCSALSARANLDEQIYRLNCKVTPVAPDVVIYKEWQRVAHHVRDRKPRRIQMIALDEAPGPPGLPIPRFIAWKASVKKS